MKYELGEMSNGEKPFCMGCSAKEGDPIHHGPCRECGARTSAHMFTREGWIDLCPTCMEPYALEWIVPQ